MKIKSINAYLLKLPLTKPYTISYQTITDTEIVFLEIELENGLVGIGASNPFAEVVGETPLATLQNLQSDFVKGLAGRNILHFNSLFDETLIHFPNLPGTQAAIDIALHDALGKYLNISVLDFYGQKIKSLPTSITIGIKDTSEMIEEAKNYYNEGFRILKIKTGVDVEQDIERVNKLTEQFGNSMRIRVDANQGYDLRQLQQFIKATKTLKIELIEQPLTVGEDFQLMDLTEMERKILVADESLLDVASALKLASLPQPYGVFNIKLMKCGGIKAAREIASIANHSKIDLFWGCNDESLVGIAAALHTAFSCSNTKYLDLDGSFDIVETIVKGGFIVKEGQLYPNGLPGLGVERI